MNALPGVEVASAIIPLPLSGIDESWDERLTVEGQPALPFGQAPIINDGRITPHYFRTMEIPLLAGRAFNDADTPTRHAWRSLTNGWRASTGRTKARSANAYALAPPNDAPWHTIVGVVGTVQHERLDAATRKMAYVPSLQNPCRISDAGRPLESAAGIAGPCR